MFAFRLECDELAIDVSFGTATERVASVLVVSPSTISPANVCRGGCRAVTIGHLYRLLAGHGMVMVRFLVVLTADYLAGGPLQPRVDR